MNIFKNGILYFYAKIFSRIFFYVFNKFLFNASLRGLGIYNYQNSKISGELSFLKRYLEKISFPIIFDVGANRGDYSLLAIKINQASKVFAFEPSKETFPVLIKNCAGRNIVPVNMAVSNEKGKMKLYDYADLKGSEHASLCADVIENVHKAKSTCYDVDVITLDEFIFNKEIKKINLLKIDVEGNELNVLLGAKQAISKNIIDVIQFEFTQINSTSKVFMKDFFAILYPQYDLFRLLPSGILPLGNYNATEHEIFGYQNIIAVRRDNEISRLFNL